VFACLRTGQTTFCALRQNDSSTQAAPEGSVLSKLFENLKNLSAWPKAADKRRRSKLLLVDQTLTYVVIINIKQRDCDKGYTRKTQDVGPIS
jgi:hypothetical protein